VRQGAGGKGGMYGGMEAPFTKCLCSSPVLCKPTYLSSSTSRQAKMAALALSVSKMVSTIKKSHPPSSSPRTSSAYASTSSSNVVFL
jgi:hypothetical protein